MSQVIIKIGIFVWKEGLPLATMLESAVIPFYTDTTLGMETGFTIGGNMLIIGTDSHSTNAKERTLINTDLENAKWSSVWISDYVLSGQDVSF